MLANFIFHDSFIILENPREQSVNLSMNLDLKSNFAGFVDILVIISMTIQRARTAVKQTRSYT